MNKCAVLVVSALLFSGTGSAAAECPEVVIPKLTDVVNCAKDAKNAAQLYVNGLREAYLAAKAAPPPAGAKKGAMSAATRALGMSVEQALIDKLLDLRKHARDWSYATAAKPPEQRPGSACLFRLFYALDEELLSYQSFKEGVIAREAMAKKAGRKERPLSYAAETNELKKLLAEMAKSSDPMEANTAKYMLAQDDDNALAAYHGDETQRKLAWFVEYREKAKGQFQKDGDSGGGDFFINPLTVWKDKATLKGALVHEFGHYVSNLAGLPNDKYRDEFHGYWREFLLSRGPVKTAQETKNRAEAIHHELLVCLMKLKREHFDAPIWPLLDNNVKVAMALRHAGRPDSDSYKAAVARLSSAEKSSLAAAKKMMEEAAKVPAVVAAVAPAALPGLPGLPAAPSAAQREAAKLLTDAEEQLSIVPKSK